MVKYKNNKFKNKIKKKKVKKVVAPEQKATIAKFEDSNIYYFTGYVGEDSIKKLYEWIILKNLQNEHECLKIIINSGGGLLHHGIAVLEAIINSTIPVYTYAIGDIASAATIILMAGKKRYISPKSVIMTHRYSSGSSGKDYELHSRGKHFSYVTDMVDELYSEYTGLSVKKVKKHLLSYEDKYLTAEEAIKYGLADELGVCIN